MSFSDLPTEVLMQIYENVAQPSDCHQGALKRRRVDLRSLVSVKNRACYAAAAPLLQSKVCLNAWWKLNAAIQLVPNRKRQVRNLGSYQYQFHASVRELDLSGVEIGTSSTHLDEQYVQNILNFVSSCRGRQILRLTFDSYNTDDHADWAAIVKTVLSRPRFPLLRELDIRTQANVEGLDIALTSLNQAGITNSILQKNLTGITTLSLCGGRSIKSFASHMQSIKKLFHSNIELHEFLPANQPQPFGSNVAQLTFETVQTGYSSLIGLLRSVGPTLKVLNLCSVLLNDELVSSVLRVLAEICPALLDMDIERMFDMNFGLYFMDAYLADYWNAWAEPVDGFRNNPEGLYWLEQLAENVDAHRRACGLTPHFTMFLELPWNCVQ